MVQREEFLTAGFPSVGVTQRLHDETLRGGYRVVKGAVARKAGRDGGREGAAGTVAVGQVDPRVVETRQMPILHEDIHDCTGRLVVVSRDEHGATEGFVQQPGADVDRFVGACHLAAEEVTRLVEVGGDQGCLLYTSDAADE